MSLLVELKDRKVFQVAAAYAVVAWLLVQVVNTVMPALKLPEWTVTFATVLLILCFPVAVLLGWSFDVVRAGSTRRESGATSVAPAVAGARGGLVVLPFANMSEDTAQAHFADGIVEDLTTRLQATGLKVLSRQSAFAYKGRSADARTIGRELGCHYVLEGSVRKVGDRIRLTAQLIDAHNDEHLWAEKYDRELSDVFELQDEVSGRIAEAIRERLGATTTADANAAAASVSSAAVATAPVSAAATAPASRKGAFAARLHDKWTLLGGGLVMLALAAALTWTLQLRSKERWAREQALPELESLITNEDPIGAFDLAGRIAAIVPNDPRLKALEPEYMARVTLATSPVPAKVYYRPYGGDDSTWRYIGDTPLERLPAPLGYGIWKFEAAGRTTTLRAMRNPGVQLQSESEPSAIAEFRSVDMTIPMSEVADVPAGMVVVPATRLKIPLVTTTAVDLPAFYLDRLEATNREYKEFVDAGGYREAAYWQDLPFASGSGWQHEVAGFVDSTGRPGPATWEAGSYPDGAADLPVGGLSWFEAAAYARFRGKELPTAYHWYRAANSLREVIESVSSVTLRHSNFSGKGPVPVGTSRSIGPFGAEDMAGNVREWLWNDMGHGRWIAGGSWNEPQYMFNQDDAANPYDRSVTNGVRCMRTPQGGPVAADLRKPITQTIIDFKSLTASTDAVYAAISGQYGYVPAATAPVVKSVPSTNPAWTHEEITIPTGYDDDTIKVQLFLPTSGTPPYEPIVFGPHSGFRMGVVKSPEFDPSASSDPLDFLLRSGRALVVIAFDSTFERSWSPERRATMPKADRLRLALRHWRQDLGRTLDYLETRDDIAADRVGYYGISYGAQSMLPLIALEPRIKAVVLNGGGIYLVGVPPNEEPFNYYPRITQPVLMLNGRWDIDVPLESQQAMYDMLGTPADRKQHVLFEAGHGVIPQRPLMSAMLDWFDRYLGPPP